MIKYNRSKNHRKKSISVFKFHPSRRDSRIFFSNLDSSIIYNPIWMFLGIATRCKILSSLFDDVFHLSKFPQQGAETFFIISNNLTRSREQPKAFRVWWHVIFWQ